MGRKTRIMARALLILGSLACSPCSGKAFLLAEFSNQELELELDAYYSALDYIRPLTDAPIPRIETGSETSVYGHLLGNLHNPRFLLLEVSANPLPIVGTFLRERHGRVYSGADVSQGTNLIGMLTTGFREPGAVSFFLGNVVNFVSDQEGGQAGKGYSGYLISYGNAHIYNNHWIDDHWLETEIKLKGSSEEEHRTMSWSFRVGGKYHLHPDIRNLWYFSIARDRVDYRDRGFSLLRNSSLEYRVDLDFMSMRFTRYLLVAGKKFPFGRGKMALTFDVGVLREVHGNYRGSLEEFRAESEWSVIIRPNLKF